MSEPRSELHITFVCTGNICRSPMAEKMFAHQITQRGLHDAVRVTSAGTAGWHIGKCADERANRVLRAHGYPTDHSAAQVDDRPPRSRPGGGAGPQPRSFCLQQLGVDADRIRMLRSFDPRSGAYALDVDDPYYGDHDDFETVFAAIEASLPGLHNWVDERLAAGRAPLMRRLAFLLRPGWVALAVVVIAFTYLCFSVLAPWQLGKNTKTSRENDQIQQSLTTDAGAVENSVAAARFIGSRRAVAQSDGDWALPAGQAGGGPVAGCRRGPGHGGAAAFRRRRRPHRVGRPRLRAARARLPGTADRPAAARDGDDHGASARLRAAGAGQGVLHQ